MSIDDLLAGNYQPQGGFGVTCHECKKHQTLHHNGKNMLVVMGENGWVESKGKNYHADCLKNVKTQPEVRK